MTQVEIDNAIILKEIEWFKLSNTQLSLKNSFIFKSTIAISPCKIIQNQQHQQQ